MFCWIVGILTSCWRGFYITQPLSPPRPEGINIVPAFHQFEPMWIKLKYIKQNKMSLWHQVHHFTGKIHPTSDCLTDNPDWLCGSSLTQSLVPPELQHSNTETGIFNPEQIQWPETNDVRVSLPAADSRQMAMSATLGSFQNMFNVRHRALCEMFRVSSEENFWSTHPTSDRAAGQHLSAVWPAHKGSAAQ